MGRCRLAFNTIPIHIAWYLMCSTFDLLCCFPTSFFCANNRADSFWIQLLLLFFSLVLSAFFHFSEWIERSKWQQKVNILSSYWRIDRKKWPLMNGGYAFDSFQALTYSINLFALKAMRHLTCHFFGGWKFFISSNGPSATMPDD